MSVEVLVLVLGRVTCRRVGRGAGEGRGEGRAGGMVGRKWGGGPGLEVRAGRLLCVGLAGTKAGQQRCY